MYYSCQERAGEEIPTRLRYAIMVFGMLFAEIACGGGSNKSYPVLPSISSVSVVCTPSVVVTNATSQCNAVVQGTGTYSTGVLWSASAGTTEPNGLFTAPASNGSVNITATSTQDSTKSGSVSVTVQATPSTIASVAVTCNPSTIGTGANSQCHAMVQGTGIYSSAVTWDASGGNVNANGLFTAPPSPATISLTATSIQDPTKNATASLTVQRVTPQSNHVVILMEENQDYSTVVGNTSAWPNLNNLISNGALPTNYYANSHPSIGNYFMLTTGQLLTTDDNSTRVWNVDNIGRRMLAAGVTFKIYAEGITQGYLGGNTGPYLIRHNPFAMLSDIAGNQQVADKCIWPFTQFAADLAAGTLPQYSFIVPNVDDDAHDGTPQQADTWLQGNVVGPLSNDSAFASGGDGLLIDDFDEATTSDNSHGGGRVVAVLWGPNVNVGYRQTSTTIYQHQSILRTSMEALRLSSFPGAAAAAPSMSEFFVQK